MQQIIIKRLSCFGRGRFGLAIVWSILWGAGMWGQGWRWGFITFSVWIKGNARLLFCLFFSSMNLSSFSIGFDSNMQHIPQPSRQQTVLQEFINLRRGIDPKSFTSWGNAKDTSFSALSYASKYIKKKKVLQLFLSGPVLLVVSVLLRTYLSLPWLPFATTFSGFFLLKKLAKLPRI